MFFHLRNGRCLWFFCCSLCFLLCAASVEESWTGSTSVDRKSYGTDLDEGDNEGRAPRGIGSRRHMRKDDADRVASYFLNGGPLVGHSHFVGASRQNCDQNPPGPGQDQDSFLVGAPHEAGGGLPPAWASGPGWFPGYHPIGDIHSLHQNFFRTAHLPFHGIAHAHSIFNGLFSPPLVRAPNPTNGSDSSGPNGEPPGNVADIVGSPKTDQAPPFQDSFPNDLSNTYFHYNNMFGGYHPQPTGYIVRMVPHAPYDPSNEQAAGAPAKGMDKAGDAGSIVGSPKGPKEPEPKAPKPKDSPDEQKRKEKCRSTTEKSNVNSGKEEGAKNNETEKKVVRRYRPQESANNLSRRD